MGATERDRRWRRAYCERRQRLGRRQLATGALLELLPKSKGRRRSEEGEQKGCTTLRGGLPRWRRKACRLPRAREEEDGRPESMSHVLARALLDRRGDGDANEQGKVRRLERTRGERMEPSERGRVRGLYGRERELQGKDRLHGVAPWR